MSESHTIPAKYAFRLLGDRAGTLAVVHFDPLTSKGNENDPRLGVQNTGGKCATCTQDFNHCPGHLGVYDTYPLPVPITYQHLQGWASIICSFCGRIGLAQSERASIKSRRGTIGIKEISEALQGQSADYQCPFCKKPFRVFKPVGFKVGSMLDHTRPALFYIDYPKRKRKEDLVHMSYSQLPIADNHYLWDRLKMASREDALLVGFNPETYHPSLFMTRYVPIAPPAARPKPSANTKFIGKSKKLYELVESYQIKIGEALSQRDIPTVQKDTLGTPAEFDRLVENVFLLYYIVVILQFQLSDGLYLAVNKILKIGKKQPQSYINMLRGKKGVLRYLLGGCRHNVNVRTPLTGYTYGAIGTVSFPRVFAMNITFEETVTPLNIEIMRSLIRNGPNIYPGANSYKRDGRVYSLKGADLEMVANSLIASDIVLRHVRTGDVGLHQRYPSIREESIDGSIMVVEEVKLVRSPLAACEKKMADFDGDDTEIFFISSAGPASEALLLQSLPRQFIAPADGNPCVGASEDAIDGLNLLLRLSEARPFTQREVNAIFRSIFTDTPPPTNGKKRNGVVGYTYTDLIEAVLPKGLYFDAKANGIKAPEVASISGISIEEAYGVREPGDLLIIGGKVERGLATPNGFRFPGGDAHILKAIATTIDPYSAIKVLEDITRIAYSANGLFGQSIGDDARRSEPQSSQISAFVDKRIEEMDAYAMKFHRGQLPIPVGQDPPDYYERVQAFIMSGKYGKDIFILVRELLKGSTYEKSGYLNSFETRLFGALGTRGQVLHDGRRPWWRLCHKTRHLPFYPKGDDSAVAAGCIKSSFMDKMTPPEHHNAAASERLEVFNKGVGVQKQGYYNRKLGVSLGPLYIDHLGFIRGHSHSIVSFFYGHTNADSRCVIPVEVDAHLIPTAKFESTFGLPESKGKWKNEAEMELLNHIRDEWRSAIASYANITSNDKFDPMRTRYQSPINMSSILLVHGPTGRKDGAPVPKPATIDEIWHILKDIDKNLVDAQLGLRAGKFTKKIVECRVRAFMRLFRFTCHTSKFISEKWSREELVNAMKNLIRKYVLSLVPAGDLVGRKATLNAVAPQTQGALHSTRSGKGIGEGVDLINRTHGTDLFVEVTEGTVPKNPVSSMMLHGSNRYNFEESLEFAKKLSSVKLVDALISGTLFSISPDAMKGKSCGIDKLKKWIDSLTPSARKIYDQSKKSWFHAHFHLDTFTLLMNRVDVASIGHKLKEQYGEFIEYIIPIYENEGGLHLIINFKSELSIEKIRYSFDHIVKDAVIHGHPRFTNGSVISYNGMPVIGKDGGVQTKTAYRIMFNGSDIDYLMSGINREIDISAITTSSVKDSELFFGIEEARFRALDVLCFECSQLDYLAKILRRHLSVIVAYMCYRGTLTFIPRFAIGANPDVDPLEKMTFETAGDFLRQTISDAKWHDISSTIPCILYGITPPFGSGISNVHIRTEDVYSESKDGSPGIMMDEIPMLETSTKTLPTKKKKKMLNTTSILPMDRAIEEIDSSVGE